MALTTKMVTSEILMCGVKAGIKSFPGGEIVVGLIESLEKRHEALKNTARMAEFESQLTRVERGMRETVEKEIRTILTNLSKPVVPGPELTREMTELRQIYEQGWMPNLFEGILQNSTHWQELRSNPSQYGRILKDEDRVRPENGMHLILDKDKTRILEMPAASLALVLSDQKIGIPEAEMRAAQDIWAFPMSKGNGREKASAEKSIVAAFFDDLGTAPQKGECIVVKASTCGYAYRTWDYSRQCIVIVTNMRLIVRLNENGEMIFRGIAKLMDKRMIAGARIRTNSETEIFVEDAPSGGFRITSSKEAIQDISSALKRLQ